MNRSASRTAEKTYQRISWAELILSALRPKRALWTFSQGARSLKNQCMTVGKISFICANLGLRPETPPRQKPGSSTDSNPVSPTSTGHSRHSSSFKQRIRGSLSGRHGNGSQAVADATNYSSGQEASNYGAYQDRAASPHEGTPSKRGNFNPFLSGTVRRASSRRSGVDEGQTSHHSLEAEDYSRLVWLRRETSSKSSALSRDWVTLNKKLPMNKLVSTKLFARPVNCAKEIAWFC